MANVNIQLGYKDSAWFTANATLVLLAGQVVYLQQTGQYKIGNGVTQLSALAFLGSSVIATETQLVTATVVNKTGVNLLASNYQAVKVSTAQGQRLAVDFAQANNDNNSADTIGLVRENISNNQEGDVVILGQIVEVNTTGSLQGETWVDGDVLYLSPTVAGRITNIKPTGATGHTVVIGYIEYAHAIHGKIYTKIMNGWELEELHNCSDTSYTTPIDADSLLIKDSTASLWKRLTWANFKTALSSLFVGKTGNETIAGRKTFNPSITAASSIAQGTIVSPTLVASANSDVLVGLDVTPTFTNGAFTNLSNIALRINSAIQFTGTPTGLSDVNGFFGNNTNTTFFAAVGPQPICSAVNGGFMLLRGNTYSAIINQRGWIALSAGLVSTPTGKEGAISLLTGNDVEKFRLLPNGNVILQNGGTFTDAGYRLDVNGTARIQDVLTVGRLATEPTTNLQNGQIYYNTTTNKFRAYENGAWANLI